MAQLHFLGDNLRQVEVTLIFAAAILLAQSKTVSIEMESTPMPAALNRLSEVIGRRLEAAPVFREEVVFARVKNASADEVLGHLAAAFYAHWVPQSDGSMMLSRDPVAYRKVEANFAAEDEKQLAGSFEYVRRRLAEQPEELDAKAIKSYRAKLAVEDTQRNIAIANNDFVHMFTASSAEEETPGWRALARLILLLGPGPFRAMANDERTVFAERPTPMQRKLPEGSEEIVGKYRREYALIDPNQQIDRIKIVVQKWEYEMAFNVSLTSYGSDGTEIDDSSIRMADDMDRQKAPYIEPDKTPHPPDEKPLDISTEAQEARIVVAERVGSPQNRPMLFHKWEPRLEDPVRSEPTQWFLAADFVAAADGTDQNLIGTTDDLLGSYWKPMILTPTQFLSSQTTRWSKSPDGWIVVHEDEHVSRISRVEGKALIKQCLAVGGVPVDLAADWTAKYPDKWPLTNWVGDYLHVLFSGRGPYSAVATTMDSESLRLWADLGASALKLLRQGETLRLEDQRQAAKDQINRLVYWFHALDDGDAEPTQLLPNGIAGGTLSLKVSEKPVILGWNSSQGVDSIKTPLDAAMLGRSLASGSHYFQIPAATFQRWDRFRIGVHRDYNLKFSIMPGNVPMTITLGESLFDPASPILDKLPPPIGTEVEKARLAELAKPIKPDGKDVIPP